MTDWDERQWRYWRRAWWSRQWHALLARQWRMLKEQSAAPDELLDDVLAHLTMEDCAILEVVAEEISQHQGESRLSTSEIGNRAKADRLRVSHALELGAHYGFWTIDRDASGGIEVIRIASGLRHWQEQRALKRQHGIDWKPVIDP